jgi:cell division protein FtsI (penicillin-binding protein 3)
MVGSSVIGFVGADGKGQAGIELSMNRELAGVEGREIYEARRTAAGSAWQQHDRAGPVRSRPAADDRLRLQWVADRRLAAQVKRMHADWALRSR